MISVLGKGKDHLECVEKKKEPMNLSFSPKKWIASAANDSEASSSIGCDLKMILEVCLVPVEVPSDNKFKLLSQVFAEELGRMDGKEPEMLAKDNRITPGLEEQLEDGEIDPNVVGKYLDISPIILEHDEVFKSEVHGVEDADSNSAIEGYSMVSHLAGKDYENEIEVVADLQISTTLVTKEDKVKEKETLIKDGRFLIPSKTIYPKRKLHKDLNVFGPIKGSLREFEEGIQGRLVDWVKMLKVVHIKKLEREARERSSGISKICFGGYQLSSRRSDPAICRISGETERTLWRTNGFFRRMLGGITGKEKPLVINEGGLLSKKFVPEYVPGKEKELLEDHLLNVNDFLPLQAIVIGWLASMLQFYVYNSQLVSHSDLSIPYNMQNCFTDSIWMVVSELNFVLSIFRLLERSIVYNMAIMRENIFQVTINSIFWSKSYIISILHDLKGLLSASGAMSFNRIHSDWSNFCIIYYFSNISLWSFPYRQNFSSVFWSFNDCKVLSFRISQSPSNFDHIFCRKIMLNEIDLRFLFGCCLLVVRAFIYVLFVFLEKGTIGS
ncbi:hypothetical protein MA16_Dca019064 [Dendrobium catenatum]|uniref:Uncharacterized protein n=1 Tax=Dendrobium catenatum TaxID=906689 RepID=A0A2I0W2D4_9ASPA|nr:hypothetical protein MA16_Dca019064 [Dendrobium catenatum]